MIDIGTITDSGVYGLPWGTETHLVETAFAEATTEASQAEDLIFGRGCVYRVDGGTG